MKTIKERAYIFACENDKPATFFADLEKGYIAGATEQKAIDDDAIHAIVEEQVLKAIDKQKAIDMKTIDNFCENNWALFKSRRKMLVFKEWLKKAIKG